tara:strand:+ start:200 stop:1018 length:819 start_codon:yes stop_codon:yes gene_type:complete
MSTFDPYIQDAATSFIDNLLRERGLAAPANSLRVLLGQTESPITPPANVFEPNLNQTQVVTENRMANPQLLNDLANKVGSSYTNVTPNQKVVKYDGEDYVIGKDQRLVGNKVISKKAPVFGKGQARIGKGIIDFFTGNKWDLDKRNEAVNVLDQEVAQQQTPAEKLQTQIKLNQEVSKAQNELAQQRQQQTWDLAKQAQVNFMKETYPLAQAAAWDATRRSLYGDKYSLSAQQRRAAQAFGAEADMSRAIAAQAQAAAALRGKYTGRNVAIS